MGLDAVHLPVEVHRWDRWPSEREFRAACAAVRKDPDHFRRCRNCGKVHSTGDMDEEDEMCHACRTEVLGTIY